MQTQKIDRILSLFDSSDYSSIELDTSMTHPRSCDTLKGVATKSGYVAEKRERKASEILPTGNQSGSQASCIPLVFKRYSSKSAFGRGLSGSCF